MTKTTFVCEHGYPCPACAAKAKRDADAANHPLWSRYRTRVQFVAWIIGGGILSACTEFHAPDRLEVVGGILNMLLGLGLIVLSAVGAVTLIMKAKRARR